MRDYRIDRILIRRTVLPLLGEGTALHAEAQGRVEMDIVEGTQVGPMPSFAEAKSTLLVCPHPGTSSLVKPCPGTGTGYLCCGYMVVNQPVGCPLDCSYCVLQSYLGRRPLMFWVGGTEGLYAQLRDRWQAKPGRAVRVGNGELADSLALDYITGVSAGLMNQFAGRGDVAFEFKTKTDEIDSLLRSPAAPNIVVSWSMNPRSLAGLEYLSCSPMRRIQAARAVQEHGYSLAFHFDPIIYYEGWESDYAALIEAIFTTIDARRVIWISLGTLRFPPGLARVLRERQRGARLLAGEMVRCPDGKLRYLKPVRLMLLRKLYRLLRPRAPRAFLYLCMESRDVWQRTMGFSPHSSAHLARLLEEHTYSFIATRTKEKKL